MEIIIVKIVWGVFSNRKYPKVNAALTLIIWINELMAWELEHMCTLASAAVKVNTVNIKVQFGR